MSLEQLIFTCGAIIVIGMFLIRVMAYRAYNGKRFRITKKMCSNNNVKYYVEYKHWLFGWEPVWVEDIGGVNHSYSFVNYQKAKDFLENNFKQKPEKKVVFEED